MASVCGRRQPRDLLVTLLSESSTGWEPARCAEMVGHAVAVGRALGVAGDALHDLVLAAELHDVGMLALEPAVLRKPPPLSREEWAFICLHPVVGERLVAAVPSLAHAAGIVRSSYEHFDGTGYPVPLAPRIVSVCVAYHAMISNRPFRAPLSPDAAVEEIDRCASTQFDPVVVAAFKNIVGLRALPLAAIA